MHIIRLREPWTVEAPPVAVGLLRAPAAWAQLAAGQHHLSRSFNAPTGLESVREVYLVFVAAQLPLQVGLNGRSLGGVEPSACPCRFAVRDQLARTNRLEVSLTLDQTPEMAPFRVQLEIEE